MKKHSLVVLCICALSLTGCIEFIEEIRLKKDGSGVYQINLYLSEFMSMMGGLEGLGDYMGGKEEGESEEEEKPEGDFTMPALPLDNKAFSKNMDTLISLTSLAEEAQELASINQDVLQKSFIHIKNIRADNIFKMGIQFHFDNIKEIDQFYASLEDMASESERAAMTNSFMGFSGNNIFSLKGRKLRYQAGTYDWNLGKAGEGEEVQMAMLFLASASYKRIYEFPGKVKKCDNPLATVEGNKVVMELPLKKLMEGKTDMDVKIKFSKK